jgi:hypothetical protein
METISPASLGAFILHLVADAQTSFGVVKSSSSSLVWIALGVDI